MFIFLHGPDDYRRRQKEKFIIAEFEKKHSGLGVGRFDFHEEGALEKFENFIKNRSIFDSFKLAILENLSEEEETTVKAALSHLKSLVDAKEITVVISESKKPVKEFQSLLKKAFSVEAFEFLEGFEWEKFIKSETKNLGVSLSDSAVKFLAQAYQSDTWRLMTELQKISFLDKKPSSASTFAKASVDKKATEGAAIDRADLEKLDIEISPNFWNLLTGLKAPSVKARLTALERIFYENEPAGKVFNILAYQWPEKLGDFASYDLAVKSGKLGYEEALVDLAIS